MKKILFVLICLLVAGPCFAASSMVVQRADLSHSQNMLLIKILCTAHTDGLFDNKVLDDALISAGMPKYYYEMGYVIGDAWVVNSSTNDHTNAAVVTITDQSGAVLIGLGDGDDDTLTLSTAASGIARLVINSPSSQRTITSPPTIAIADTGASATVQTLYLLLRK